MAHPFVEHRAHKHEKARVAHIAHRASGGAVMENETAKPVRRKANAMRDAQIVEGSTVKARADRPNRKRGGPVMKRARGGDTSSNYPESIDRRVPLPDNLDMNPTKRAYKPKGVREDQISPSGYARGGRTKGGKHKGVTVNVIAAPGHAAGGAPPPMMPPPGAGVAPPMAHPMPPPGMPPGAPGMAPGAPPMARPPMPGMPPRRSGGAAYAKGGAVKDGPTWKEGIRSGTPMQNNPSGKNDQADVGRKRVITYAKGGAVDYPIKTGSGGGLARLRKEKLAVRGGMAP